MLLSDKFRNVTKINSYNGLGDVSREFFFHWCDTKSVHVIHQKRIIFHSNLQICIGIFCALEKKSIDIFTNKKMAEIMIIARK